MGSQKGSPGGSRVHLTPLRLTRGDETPEGGPRLRFFASVLPSTACLVEERLVEYAEATGEDGVGAGALVYKVDNRSVLTLRS